MSSIQIRAWNIEYDFAVASVADCGSVSFVVHVEDKQPFGFLVDGLNITLEWRCCDVAEA